MDHLAEARKYMESKEFRTEYTRSESMAYALISVAQSLKVIAENSEKKCEIPEHLRSTLLEEALKGRTLEAQGNEKINLSGGPKEFNLSELTHWLEIAEMRWGSCGAKVTARLCDRRLAILQDGKYRASVNLDDERPELSNWADDDA